MALNPIYSEVPENPDVVFLVEKTLDRIHTMAVPVLRDELEKKNIRLTDKLLTGLARSVNVRTQEKIVEWAIELDKHGLVIDAKTIKYTGQPNFNLDGIGWYDYALKGYQKRGGFSDNARPWSNLPAYALKTPEATLRYISYGAIVNISKKATVRRPSSRTSWFKEYFTQIIHPMNDQFLAIANDIAISEAQYIIKKALEIKK